MRVPVKEDDLPAGRALRVQRREDHHGEFQPLGSMDGHNPDRFFVTFRHGRFGHSRPL